ncbi:barstar family protein [Sphingopyxis indica]|uniref:barstar family protein n=1 Tax=Sphingopyxis indica TaxID=436663 RepID=UPI0029390EA4|nr:barstar family protein [Sphingopyxis indica]
MFLSGRSTPRTFVIDGSNIHDIPSFYDEINRVFMGGEDWKLGPSLDALDDMLYGGYGALQGSGPVVLIWRGMERNRTDLGVEATRAYYRAKMDAPDRYNVARINDDLAALERGEGATYFEIICEILAGHPRIEVRAES